jgi:8-oxo-dGTP diphosphatase
MLNDLLGAIWQRAPKTLRRWTVGLSHPRFAVTAGAIVTDSHGRVLLLKHRFRPGAGWGMPGGFLKTGEHADDALRRELREETGLEIESLELVTTRTFNRPGQVEIVFRCRALGHPDHLNYEIQKAAWFYPSELPPELPEDQLALIKQVLSDGAESRD